VSDPMLTEDRLPPDVAGLLRDAARARTEGSAPFPRMHRAIRRDRRRRAAGGAAVAMAAVVAATVATGVVGPDRAAPPPAKREATPTPTVQRTPDPGPDGDPLHFAGSTAGSLAGDAAWIQGMKQRLVGLDKASDAGHARVLWAADYGGRRVAVTVGQDGSDVSLNAWRGPAGAAPAAMEEGASSGTSLPAGTPPELEPYSFVFRKGDGGEGPGILVALGGRFSRAEVGSRFDYAANGRQTASWRPLVPEAAVWVVEASAEELDGMTYRARKVDGTLTQLGGSGGISHQGAPRVDIAAVSPAGSDPQVLTCATMAFTPEVGGMPEGSTPILGGAPKIGDQWYGIAVARAPGGGYVVGTCPSTDPEESSSAGSLGGRGFVVPAPAGGPAELFVLAPTSTTVKQGDTTTFEPAAVVVAPEGATEVEVAGKSVPVRDRLAVVTGVPQNGLTAIARDANGRELGRTGAAPDTHEVAQVSLYGGPG
jgi:hypothetical protein